MISPDSIKKLFGGFSERLSLTLQEKFNFAERKNTVILPGNTILRRKFWDVKSLLGDENPIMMVGMALIGVGFKKYPETGVCRLTFPDDWSLELYNSYLQKRDILGNLYSVDDLPECCEVIVKNEEGAEVFFISPPSSSKMGPYHDSFIRLELTDAYENLVSKKMKNIMERVDNVHKKNEVFEKTL
ncbi:MAG: hypothetical protein H6861_05710 [Rhodospirillales bacterium]|nr:hypothetical protein [Rhodospirillales bacterium]